MSAFSALLASRERKAARTVDVPMSAWADDYASAPRDVVVMGLRRLAEKELETARAEAAKRAWSMHPEPHDEANRIDCFNDALIRWAIGRALCMPDDVGQNWFDEAQEDVVAQAFTVDGARYIWDHLDMLAVSESPVVPEATDEDVGKLAKLVADGSLAKLPMRQQSAARRYIGAVLEMISPETEAA